MPVIFKTAIDQDVNISTGEDSTLSRCVGRYHSDCAHSGIALKMELYRVNITNSLNSTSAEKSTRLVSSSVNYLFVNWQN